MQNQPARLAVLRRLISSLVAIAAVSTIFGAKALESGQRADAVKKIDLAQIEDSGRNQHGQ